MQKTELLHLHSLFRQLKQYLEREGHIDENFEHYESVGVRPSHAHKPKEPHREAVFALASDLTDELAVNSKYADDGASNTDGEAPNSEDGRSNGDDEHSDADNGSSDPVVVDG